MSKDYQDLTTLDVEGEGEAPIRKAPSRLPPSHTWKQRLFPSRRLALILLGLSAILSTMLIVFGVQGDDFSIQLWRMREMLEGMNGTAAVEMAALSKKTELEAKVTEVETTVTALAAEMDAGHRISAASPGNSCILEDEGVAQLREGAFAPHTCTDEGYRCGAGLFWNCSDLSYCKPTLKPFRGKDESRSSW